MTRPLIACVLPPYARTLCDLPGRVGESNDITPKAAHERQFVCIPICNSSVKVRSPCARARDAIALLCSRRHEQSRGRSRCLQACSSAPEGTGHDILNFNFVAFRSGAHNVGLVCFAKLASLFSLRVREYVPSCWRGIIELVRRA
jgi:hypothetical protein